MDYSQDAFLVPEEFTSRAERFHYARDSDGFETKAKFVAFSQGNCDNNDW